jgi:hypothetical protein
VPERQHSQNVEVSDTSGIVALRRSPRTNSLPLSYLLIPFRIQGRRHDRHFSATLATQRRRMTRQDWLSRSVPPEEPKATASSFANWVFESCVGDPTPLDDRASRSHRLRLGRITHRSIELFMQFKWTQRFLAGHPPSDWKLEFADTDEGPSTSYVSSVLSVGGRPLRGLPDVVLRNTGTNTVLIIERKTTYVPAPQIPATGWPNVEAQLWCYSLLDAWSAADEVLLVGQLWHRERFGLTLCHEHPAWRRSDQKHHRRCAEWFLRYGGGINKPFLFDRINTFHQASRSDRCSGPESET